MNAVELATLEQRVHAITRPQPQLLWFYALSALVSACAWPVVMVPLYFRYHTLWYRFGAEGVAMGYGILFRRELQLTYARMQDIHLSQNLLERWLGIGTVTVQTAGAGAGGNLSIVGVRDFAAIRDYLYAKMRGARGEATAPTPASGDTTALLTEIRDALRSATAALDGQERAP